MAQILAQVQARVQACSDSNPSSSPDVIFTHPHCREASKDETNCPLAYDGRLLNFLFPGLLHSIYPSTTTR